MATLGIYLMGAALLVVAGGLKAFRPADTARAVAGVLPRTPPNIWPPIVRIVAGLEAGLGAGALLHPGRLVALGVAASYLGFAVWVLWARAHGGALSTCGCFGTPDVPPTVAHAVLNAVVALGATGVAVSAPTGWILTLLSAQYLHGVPLVVASVIAVWLAYLVMVPVARLAAEGAHRTGPAGPHRTRPAGRAR